MKVKKFERSEGRETCRKQKKNLELFNYHTEFLNYMRTHRSNYNQILC